MLKIPKDLVDEMVAHARAEDPNECCGILAGRDGRASVAYRITNVARSPFRYLMDPQEFLRADMDAEARGLRLVAFYHSHTHSPAYPSPTDVRMAQESGWTGDSICYLLVSLEDKERPVLRAFRIDDDGRVTEVELETEGD